MQCDVTDLKGNHCPEEAVHTVVFKGVETHLCERCHANVLAGAYGSHLTQRVPDVDEQNCPACDGSGELCNQWGQAVPCDECKGTGSSNRSPRR